MELLSPTLFTLLLLLDSNVFIHWKCDFFRSPLESLKLNGVCRIGELTVQFNVQRKANQLRIVCGTVSVCWLFHISKTNNFPLARKVCTIPDLIPFFSHSHQIYGVAGPNEIGSKLEITIKTMCNMHEERWNIEWIVQFLFMLNVFVLQLVYCHQSIY